VDGLAFRRERVRNDHGRPAPASYVNEPEVDWVPIVSANDTMTLRPVFSERDSASVCSDITAVYDSFESVLQLEFSKLISYARAEIEEINKRRQAQSRLDPARAERDRLHMEYDRFVALRDSLVQKRNQAENDYDVVRSNPFVSPSEKQRLQEEFEAAEQALADAEKALADTRQALTAVQQELAAAELFLQAEQSQKQALTENIARLEKQLDTALSDLDQQRTKALEQCSRNSDVVTLLERSLSELDEIVLDSTTSAVLRSRDRAIATSGRPVLDGPAHSVVGAAIAAVGQAVP
jgi:chromosome segregation ATPase